MIVVKIIFTFLSIYLGLFFLTLLLSFCTKWYIILSSKYKMDQELKERELKKRNYTPKKKKEAKKVWNKSLGVWEIEE